MGNDAATGSHHHDSQWFCQLAKESHVIFMLVAVGLGPPAFADPLQEAREHYRRGAKAFEVAHYDEAADEFSAAHKLKDDPTILFNLAQAYRLGGHREKALGTYRTFLVKVPNAPNRREVEALINGLKPGSPSMAEDPDSELARRYYEAGAKNYEANEYEAAIVQFEKARVIRPLAALDFNIGRCHDRLGHTREALVAYRRYVAAKPEPNDIVEVRERIVVLEKRLAVENPVPTPVAAAEGASLAAPAQGASAAPAAPTHAVGARNKTIAGIAVAVFGAAALVGGVVSGVLAQENADDLTKLAQTKGTFVPSKESAGEGEQIAEGVLFGIGAVAVATGAVLLVLGRRVAPSRRASLVPTIGAHAALSWSF
jgi:tetratricopeptide (TPR) repeat protein